MTKNELNTFREILESRRTELGIGNREALAVEASPDEMDRVQHFSQREYAMNHLERTSNRLREVRAALNRMDAGNYGVCTECDENIKMKRLLAVPWVSTCITCQEAAENARSNSGDSLDTPEDIAA
jgi:DnaK suppressor protein